MRIDSQSTPTNHSTPTSTAENDTESKPEITIENRPQTQRVMVTLLKPATVVHKSKLSRDPRAKIRVTVVGAGGNGSQVMPCLARLNHACRSLGLPQLDVTLYDPDRVSASNVARQLFYPDDIGQGKAVCLIHRINMGFRLAWRAVSASYPHRRGYKLSPSDSLAAGEAAMYRDGADILITCVDTGAARKAISDACLNSPEPPLYWLDLGNEGKTGQVWLGEFPQPGDPKQRNRHKDPARLRTVVEKMPEFYDGTLPESNLPSCSLAEALESQDLFINDHVSRWGVTLLWHLLRAGQIEHQGYWVNLKSGTVTPEEIYTPDAFKFSPASQPSIKAAAVREAV